MGDAVLTTKLSRRTMLAGGGAAISTTAIPYIAAPPDPDAELLRHIAVAKRRWADFVAARETRKHLYKMTCRYAGCSSRYALSAVTRIWFNKHADKTGYREAANSCEQMHELYGEAMDKAFGTPACTVQGLYVKLKFAAEMAQIGDSAAYLGTEFEWLDFVIADLERQAG